jgi:hypothetical protein
MAVELDPEFGKRLREALDRWGAGDGKESIRASARRIGISHVMLQRALDGRVPNTPALKKIAKSNGVTVDWLLNGDGQSPDWRSRFAVAHEWAQLIESLKLPADVRALMLEFPKATNDVVFGMILDDTHTAPDGSTWNRGGRETPALYEGIRTERRAWTIIFRDWIKQAGADRVREQVVEHQERFRARLGPVKLPNYRT